jgi:hypothetical protein
MRREYPSENEKSKLGSSETFLTAKNSKIRRIMSGIFILSHSIADFGEIAHIKRSKPHSREGEIAG